MGNAAAFREHLDAQTVESLAGDRWNKEQFLALADERGEITLQQLMDLIDMKQNQKIVEDGENFQEKLAKRRAEREERRAERFAEMDDLLGLAGIVLPKIDITSEYCEPTQSMVYTVTGVVLQTNFEYNVSQAVIRNAGGEELLAVTDERGGFEFTTTVVDLILCIQCDGFAPSTCRSKAPHTIELNVRLLAVSFVQIVNSAVDSVVSAPDSSWTVHLRANSFTFEDGTLFSGNAKVSVTLLDACDPKSVASMPGDFSAITAGGQLVQLQTFGAMWVGATDHEHGHSLHLANDRKMELNFQSSTAVSVGKLPPGLLPSAWSFDATRCVWVDESEGEEPLSSSAALSNATTSIDSHVVVSVDGVKLSMTGTSRKLSQAPTSRELTARGGRKVKYRKEAEIKTWTLKEFTRFLSGSKPRKWTMSVGKLGWWNIDSPYLAVLVSGQLELPVGLSGCCLTVSSRGLDYHGLTHSTPTAEGVFSVMAQFSSSIMLDVTGKKNTHTFAESKRRQTSAGKVLEGEDGEYQLSFGPFETGNIKGANINVGPLSVPSNLFKCNS